MHRPARTAALLAIPLTLAACANNGPRDDLVTLRGEPITLKGDPERLAPAGKRAPDFRAVANDGSERSLKEFRGSVVVLSTVPSVETSVCDLETRTFNERAAALPGGVVVVTVSKDSPDTLAQWCGANGIDRVVTLSDEQLGQVGRRYGLVIEQNGVLARAVHVIDRDGVLRYREIVPELTSEPSYDAALGVAAALAQG